MNKDLNLTMDLITEYGLDLEGVKLVRSVYEEGMEQKLNREDFSASYKVVEDLSKKNKLQ
jgi:3-hydroxyisobutyrate dehydrogenase-like beta-hydroxyacid dehydrogenase